MSKVSKFYERKRQEKAKLSAPSKEDRKKREEIELIVARAKERKANPKYKEQAKAAFYQEYFKTLRPENTSSIYPSLNDNTPNSSATAKKGILEQRIKLNTLEPNMRAREIKALAEAEMRAKSVAPAYNKGGLQPINPRDLHSVGKKYEY